MAKRRESFFWTSYSDMMTSLFFVMLALYAVTFYLLRKQQEYYMVEAEKWKKVSTIQLAVNGINPMYFAYDATYEKHVLNVDFSFRRGNADILQIDSFARMNIQRAGRQIETLLNSFSKVKFLVIIEGQASRDGAPGNFRLSHERALTLHRYWQEFGINLEKRDNCELIIAGSGEGGVPRKLPDSPPNNQRFLIHIIPKLGTI